MKQYTRPAKSSRFNYADIGPNWDAVYDCQRLIAKRPGTIITSLGRMSRLESASWQHQDDGVYDVHHAVKVAAGGILRSGRLVVSKFSEVIPGANIERPELQTDTKTEHISYAYQMRTLGSANGSLEVVRCQIAGGVILSQDESFTPGGDAFTSLLRELEYGAFDGASLPASSSAD